MYDNVKSAATMEIEQHQTQQPISRTYQYRKVMKPMLERKRRARINRCLDELKDLMVWALQAEGENVSKLEKADILELTVRHLHRLRKQDKLILREDDQQICEESEKFREGYTRCAHEVSRYLAAVPGVDVKLGTKLMTHLGHKLNEFECQVPLSVKVQDNRSLSPATTISSSEYSLPLTPASSRSSESPSPIDYTAGLLKVAEKHSTPVWRPW